MERVRQFRDERDWQQFHTLKDLASAISIEAAELQEILLWQNPEHERELLAARREDLEAELADVVIHALNFALAAEIDLAAAVVQKLAVNAVRYPVSKARGRSTKHSGL